MNKSFASKYKDPRWQKVRLQVMERDNFTCQACGRKNEPLHVHHLSYGFGDPWKAPLPLLETLCETCHGARTEFDAMDIERIRQRPTKEVVTKEGRKNYLQMIGKD